MDIQYVVDTFLKATGLYPQETDIAKLAWYAHVADEAEMMDVIEDMAQHYDDPETAEVGFIILWDYLAKTKS